MSLLALSVLFILLIAAFRLAYRNLQMSFLVTVFLSPWYGLDLDIGLRITAFQIFLIPLLLFSLKELSLFKNNVLMTFFVSYSILWTLGQIPFLPETIVTGGALRTPVIRSLIQIPMFLLTISPLFVAQSLIKTRDELLMVGKIYIISCVCLALLGWLQLVLWYGTGTNYLPIGITDSLLGGMAETREGYYEFLHMNVYRMNSLGGEPKNLGAAFVVGMLLIQAALPIFYNRKNLLILWLFLAASTVATMSTTGFLLWVIGTLVQLFLVFFWGKLENTYRKSYLTSLMFFIVVLLSISVIAESTGFSIIKMVQDRTVDRFESSETGALEDFDAAILNYFKDNPLAAVGGVGFGNIHLYARPYLTSDAFEYASKSVFTAKAQYLKIISETGIISLIIFILWGLRLLNQRARGIIAPVDYGNSKMLATFGVSMIVIYLSAGSIAPQFFLAMGAIGANISEE